MKIRLTVIVMVLAAALAALTAASCGNDETNKDAKSLMSAYFIISHLDASHDGVPDAYQYRIRVSADSASTALTSAPSVRQPNGTVLSTTCISSAGFTVCETAPQTPPAPGAKADIPAGVYSIMGNGGAQLDFNVTATALAVPDIAGVDLATLAPLPPATLADPAFLAWAAAAGTAGSHWEYTITNIDLADDNGQVASGTTPDWATAHFSLDLPNTWDSADPLLVELDAVGFVAHHEYVEIDLVQSIVTGYTRL